MHKRFRFLFLLPVLLLTSIAACVRAECALWEAVSGNQTIYLAGSVHLLKAENYPLPREMMQAYAVSDVIVFEVDPSEMMTPEAQAKMAAKATLPKGRKLKDELDGPTYARLEKVLKEAGLPPGSELVFKPWFILLQVTIQQLESMGFESSLGLDQYFHGKAVKDGKKVLGLETVDFQLNLFDKLTGEKQNEFVQHGLNDLDELKETAEVLMKAWEKGDMEKLSGLLLDSFADYPDIHRAFVTDRNRNWVKKLDELVPGDQTLMVVVGCAHLVGEEGVIELLRKKGFEIRQF